MKTSACRLRPQDFLVRLAVAIGCCDAKPSPAPAPAPPPPAPPAPKPSAPSSGRTSLNGAAGDPGLGTSFGRTPEPKPSLEAMSRGWTRSVAAEEAGAAVRRLLGRMRLSRTDLLGLKQRLDALARMAGERAVGLLNTVAAIGAVAAAPGCGKRRCGI